MEVLFAGECATAFFAIVLFFVGIALEREGADFNANARSGKAEVVGYERTAKSNWYELLVRIPDLNDGKIYNCTAGKGINPSEYPKGAIVDVLYAPKTIVGIRVIEAHLKENPPADKARVGRIIEQLAFALLGVAAILCVVGIVASTADDKDYFHENSQVIKAIDVNESEDTLTEAEAFSTFRERGFKDYPITTEYSADGNFNDAAEISSSSSERHPMYQTYYVSNSDEFWIVSLIGGDIVANPVSYNMQTASETQLIISESEIITSYDSSTNTYYRTVPNDSALLVRVVDKIDADTLDTLTMEKLRKSSDTDGIEYYESSENNIITENGITFINNEILIALKSDQNKAELDNYLSEIGGRVVGEVSAIAEYQILLDKAYSHEELSGIVEEIKSFDWVAYASLNYAVKLSY